MKSCLCALAALAVVSWVSGCCACKSLFGSTSYSARIQADSDANKSGPTDVLVIWPSPEKTSEFTDLKTIEEAHEKIKSLRLDEDYTVADFKTIHPGDRRVLYEIPVGGGTAGLTTHCYSSHVFVFTTIPGKKGSVMEPLVRPGAEYAGYLRIDLREDRVEISFEPFDETTG